MRNTVTGVMEAMDEPLASLPERVLADVRKAYSEKVIDHAMNPRNVGEIPDADGYGSAIGSCNDSMEIWLRVRGGQITEARFWTEGCAETIATGSALTEMARGKSPLEALRITPEDVIAALDGLPPENQHCAVLAVNSLREAIKNYLALQREPWRKLYRSGKEK